MRCNASSRFAPFVKVLRCAFAMAIANVMLATGFAVHAQAQAQLATASASAPATTARSAEQGPKWGSLPAATRGALAPLQDDWSTFGADQKQKWVELAAQMPSMSSDERQRVQARMTEWSKLTPEQRGATRFQFKQAKELAPTNRQARWDAYQALPDGEKKELASRAPPPQTKAEAKSRARALRAESASQPGAQSKSNMVVKADPSRKARAVAPAVVQAPAGATTTLMSKVPAPPVHQQAGLPKITASPTFVNPSTLLPQRGPQGAAAITSVASAPAPAQAPAPAPDPAPAPAPASSP